jgi:hypothetical protein
MIKFQGTRLNKDRKLVTGIVGGVTLSILSACSDLQPVADFGKNASAIAGYPEVADDYPATLQRQHLYADDKPNANDPRIAVRKHDAQRLRDAQKVLEDYAKALGALASDDLISYDKQIDALNQSIVNAKIATSADTDVYAKAAKFVFDFGTDIYRRNKIRTLITTYNPAVQTATHNLITIVEDGYLTALKDERDTFDKKIAFPATKVGEPNQPAGKDSDAQEAKPQDATPDSTPAQLSAEYQGLRGIVRVVTENQDDFLSQKKANAEALVKGMRTFAKGHQDLANNITKVSFKATVTVARSYAEQLRDILKDLRS